MLICTSWMRTYKAGPQQQNRERESLSPHIFITQLSGARDGQTDGRTDRQASRQASRQADRQTDRQTDRQRDDRLTDGRRTGRRDSRSHDQCGAPRGLIVCSPYLQHLLKSPVGINQSSLLKDKHAYRQTDRPTRDRRTGREADRETDAVP